MGFYSLEVFAPLACLLFNVIAQILILRFFSKVGFVKSVVFGFNVGLIILFVFEFYALNLALISLSEFFFIFITNTLIYISLGYCYFHFLNLGETARRIRILRELYESSDGLSESEIFQKYSAKTIIDIRLKRLLENNQVVLVDGRYYIKMPVVLFMANIISALKMLLLKKRSEFD